MQQAALKALCRLLSTFKLVHKCHLARLWYLQQILSKILLKLLYFFIKEGTTHSPFPLRALRNTTLITRTGP